MIPHRRLLLAWWALAGIFAGQTEISAAPWKPLFNGKDLSGWKVIEGPAEGWQVADGMLSCAGKGGGWLATESEYANFEVELEYRVPPAGNSGVFLRAPFEGNPAYTGMEIQILDDHDPKYAHIKPAQHCGSIYDVVAAPPHVAKKADEWQKLRIVCNGQHVQVILNDKQIVDADLTEYADKSTGHPGLKRTTGHLGLQNHDTRIDFRNLRIREL